MPRSLRSLKLKSAERSSLMASMLKISASAWARICVNRSGSVAPRSRSANCCSKTTWSSAIRADTSASSSGVAAAARFGAAATNWLLYSATPKASSSSGRLPSFTRAWALPTWSKENQPTRLAATVSRTAPPMPK